MRLIDADAFKVVLGTETKIREVFCQIIDKQPTAYNVEKVIGELEKLEDVERENAIDIVRKGGVR